MRQIPYLQRHAEIAAQLRAVPQQVVPVQGGKGQASGPVRLAGSSDTGHNNYSSMDLPVTM